VQADCQKREALGRSLRSMAGDQVWQIHAIRCRQELLQRGRLHVASQCYFGHWSEIEVERTQVAPGSDWMLIHGPHHRSQDRDRLIDQGGIASHCANAEQDIRCHGIP
jgi:hypothetical protein